jgi:hypothetical protein
VAVAIRRARRVRRGKIKHEQRSCEKYQYYFLLLTATAKIKPLVFQNKSLSTLRQMQNGFLISQ